ncbi:MAG TPA: lipopolysaccharide heptosyltransferase II [Candidatus Omnitrophota bacterium]|nr:lipopolysaccharide heptosyltransferase II [Candidatus Omnitrophota bacterium]HPS19839.1 lipopolysaccharide heptosyltransferase II [Candidatus Omnitrophota bacterium]
MTPIPRRILIARTDRIGDVVLSTPVIRFLRKKYPEAFIAFMLRPYTADIVRNDPNLNDVVIYDKDKEQKSFFSTIRFALKLRKYRFDMAIALHPNFRTHIIFFMAGIPVRIGYDKKCGWLLTQKIPHKKQEGDRHESEYNFDLLSGAGIDVSGADMKPYLYRSRENGLMVDKILKESGVSASMIAVHAGASCPSKRWPAERFREVCELLIKKTGSDIVLIGGPDAVRYSDIITESGNARIFDLTDTLRLGEVTELLSRAKVLISNDSGPVHIAAAVNTPVVSIFGRKSPGLSPKRWGPVGEKNIILHKDVGCVKCLAHECEKNFQCLLAISADDVVSATERLISEL